MGDIPAARALYETADDAASETNDPALTACILTYRSYATAARGHNGRARILLQDAQELLNPRTNPTTLAWIAAREAEEASSTGDVNGARSALGRAKDAYAAADPSEERPWTEFLTASRFSAFDLSTLARLGDGDGAQEVAAQWRTLANTTEPRKRGVVVLSSVASAYAAGGDFSEAARCGLEALAIARNAEFSAWLGQLTALDQQLSRRPTLPEVREFRDALAVTRRSLVSSRPGPT